MAFALNLENEYEKISQHSRSLERWETEQRLPVCFEKLRVCAPLGEGPPGTERCSVSTYRGQEEGKRWHVALVHSKATMFVAFSFSFTMPQDEQLFQNSSQKI